MNNKGYTNIDYLKRIEEHKEKQRKQERKQHRERVINIPRDEKWRKETESSLTLDRWVQ